MDKALRNSAQEISTKASMQTANFKALVNIIGKMGPTIKGTLRMDAGQDMAYGRVKKG